MAFEISLIREIRASQEFVFDWWTDLSSDDTKLVKPLRKREIISKTTNEIVLRDEEVMYMKKMSFLVKVTLERPKRWISEYEGKDATARSEYILESAARNPNNELTILYYHSKIEPRGFLTKTLSPFVKPLVRRVFKQEMAAFIIELQKDYYTRPR